ncbi:MAG TPA: GntR family transcriptional regulator [Dokdonella sp.]
MPRKPPAAPAAVAAPVSRTDAALAAIEQMIYDGTLLPGAALDERRLAEHFNVSRTPIREAVQQLQARGLLRVVPRQGIYVERVSLVELRNMLETLQELEAIIAKFAARRIDVAGRKALEATCARCVAAAKALNYSEYAARNSDFHEVLYAASGNRYLIEQVKLIRQRTAIYRKGLFEKTNRLERSAAEHLQIMQAVVGGDAKAAEACMRDHIIVGGAGFAEFVSVIPEALLAP